jgi:aryl sulfotransferase
MGGFYWIASYPKSGNTWMRLLLASLIAGGAAPDFDEMPPFAPLAAQLADMDLTLDVEPSDLLPDEQAELRHDLALLMATETSEPLFRKVHDCWECTPSGRPLFPAAATLGSIYLVRDPRDVAASLAHHRGSDIDSAIAFMARPNASLATDPVRLNQVAQRISSWSGHVRSWLAATPAPLLLRYEDLLADPADALKRTARHCRLEASASAIAGAVAATGFDTLKAAEDAKGFQMGQARGQRFFRRGEAGGWRDTLSAAQADRIVGDHREMMVRFGYL